jgi:hypothetical protein
MRALPISRMRLIARSAHAPTDGVAHVRPRTASTPATLATSPPAML